MMIKHISTRLFRTRLLWWMGGLGVVLSLVGIWESRWQEKQVLEPLAATSEGVLAGSQESIVPLPLHVPEDPAKVTLGERLFHDVRLSGQNTMSCATCHRLEQGGDDGLPQAMAATGTRLLRNTPTIFNVAFNAACNWDGGVRTLKARRARAAVSSIDAHHLA
jgi:cytochrome c peroxidase